MQGLHCTHFLKHQYPSTLHPLFPTYPRTVRRLRASAVLVFYTDQMNIVHSSEDAPRSFTMVHCVVVKRLEGKQRYSRAAVSKHAGIQAREWSRWMFTNKREVNEKPTKPCNSPHTKRQRGAQTTSRSSVLVRGWSTQFIAKPWSWPQRSCPKQGYISAIFPSFFLLASVFSRFPVRKLLKKNWLKPDNVR